MNKFEDSCRILRVAWLLDCLFMKLSEMHDAADRRSAKKPVVHGEIAAS